MIIPIVLSLILFWAICAVVSYKASTTYCRTEFPYALRTEEERRKDRTFHRWLALGGPFCVLTVAVCNGFKHGLHLKE